MYKLCEKLPDWRVNGINVAATKKIAIFFKNGQNAKITRQTQTNCSRQNELIKAKNCFTAKQLSTSKSVNWKLVCGMRV